MVSLFVVDTNVLVAGLISGEARSPTVQVLDAMLSGELIYLVSPALLREYRSVLLRPKLVRLHGLSAAEIDDLLAEIVANGLWREAQAPAPDPAPDPGDTHLWELLAAEPGAVLVTGDRLLLENPPSGNTVIAAADCAAWLADRRTAASRASRM